MLFRTILLLLAASSFAYGQCDNAQAIVGVLYNCEISTDLFFAGSGVIVSAKQNGFAGLPEWLTITQRNESSPAYIYGTPTRPTEILLEVHGINMDTLESRVLTIQVTITSAQGDFLQKDELYITNYELVDFLNPGVLSEFQNALTSAYQSQLSGAVPEIVGIAHPSTRGIPAPRPPLKHGVVVTTTPGLNLVREDVTNDICPLSFTLELASNNFEVGYCTTIVNTITTRPPTVANDRRFPPTAGSSITLVIVLVVTVVIIFMIISGLACILCGYRQEGYTVSSSKKWKRSTMRSVSKVTSKGPVCAQNRLRELAQPRVTAEPQQERVMNGDVMLEFQDLTDSEINENNSSESSGPDPPPYTLPNISYIRTP